MITTATARLLVVGASLAATLSVLACSSDESSGSTSNTAGTGGGAAGGTGGAGATGGEAATGEGCSELVASCLVNQQTCVEDGDGARCEPCPIGEYASAEEAECIPIPGEVMTHEFPELPLGLSEERDEDCLSWRFNNAEEMWVNAVELEQDAQSHHSNWLFVPEDRFDGPDGIWACSSRDYTQLGAAVAGGVLFAQSTHATKEVQKFPDGVAVRIPPYSKVIGGLHQLNTSGEAVTGSMTMRIYSVPRSQVNVKLAPFHLTYQGLEDPVTDAPQIPPMARSRFYGECDIEQSSQTVLSRPIDFQVYYILPHTHSLATRFFLEVFGGPRDGESIIDVAGYNELARGRYYDPPVDMTGATGFRFGCEFDNDREDAVGWGIGDQEMCENLGFIEADFAFESSVVAATQQSTDGDIQVFTDACSTIAFAYDHEKAGGTAP